MVDPDLKWDAFSESAKALINIVLGEDLTDQFHNNLISYSQLKVENKRLRSELSLNNDNSSYKDLYLNLKNEYKKMSSKHAQCYAENLKLGNIHGEYNRLKTAYQEQRKSLTTYKDHVEKIYNPLRNATLLEILFQSIKEYLLNDGLEDLDHLEFDVFVNIYSQNTNENIAKIKYSKSTNYNWNMNKYYLTPREKKVRVYNETTNNSSSVQLSTTHLF